MSWAWSLTPTGGGWSVMKVTYQLSPTIYAESIGCWIGWVCL